MKRTTLVLSVSFSVACTGRIGDPANTKVDDGVVPTAPGATPPTASPLGPLVPWTASLRRLTRTEYDNVLRDLLGDQTRSGFQSLPEDAYTPYDNDASTQEVSAALIETVETLAGDAAARILADPSGLASIVGCVPMSPSDAVCMRSFITTFGRRALRRPLSEDEVQRYLSLQSYAVESGDFYAGVDLVLRAMLQSPELLYQVEIGAGTDSGALVLSDFEIASRLSFLLWGSMPSDALLDRATSGALRAGSDRRAFASTMLADPRSAARLETFHSFWLGYFQLPHPEAVVEAMKAESGALIRRIVLEQPQDYFSLFRANETYVGPDLAMLYGLSSTATSAAWVSYGQSGRQGILSHGSVLSAFSKFDDTSPTQRGLFVRTRLLCQDIPPPPPNVNTDQPPTSPTSRCKFDRYASHRSVGSCASCHNLMDPIGFGLENYDRMGRYRTADDGAPECAIAGDGEIVGVGKFHGPAQLEDLLTGTQALESCVARQLYRFAVGHRESSEDAGNVDRLAASFGGAQRDFRELLLSLVESDAFATLKLAQ
jgi:hypothetical protein